MITKTYYLNRNAKGYKSTIDHIKSTIPCFTSAKPVEMDYVEWTFEVRTEDVTTLERMLAPLA